QPNRVRHVSYTLGFELHLDGHPGASLPRHLGPISRPRISRKLSRPATHPPGDFAPESYPDPDWIAARPSAHRIVGVGCSWRRNHSSLALRSSSPKSSLRSVRSAHRCFLATVFFFTRLVSQVN